MVKSFHCNMAGILICICLASYLFFPNKWLFLPANDFQSFDVFVLKSTINCNFLQNIHWNLLLHLFSVETEIFAVLSETKVHRVRSNFLQLLKNKVELKKITLVTGWFLGNRLVSININFWVFLNCITLCNCCFSNCFFS